MSSEYFGGHIEFVVGFKSPRRLYQSSVQHNESPLLKVAAVVVQARKFEPGSDCRQSDGPVKPPVPRFELLRRQSNWVEGRRTQDRLDNPL